MKRLFEGLKHTEQYLLYRPCPPPSLIKEIVGHVKTKVVAQCVFILGNYRQELCFDTWDNVFFRELLVCFLFKPTRGCLFMHRGRFTTSLCKPLTWALECFGQFSTFWGASIMSFFSISWVNDPSFHFKFTFKAWNLAEYEEITSSVCKRGEKVKDKYTSRKKVCVKWLFSTHRRERERGAQK